MKDERTDLIKDIEKGKTDQQTDKSKHIENSKERQTSKATQAK